MENQSNLMKIAQIKEESSLMPKKNEKEIDSKSDDGDIRKYYKEENISADNDKDSNEDNNNDNDDDDDDDSGNETYIKKRK